MLRFMNPANALSLAGLGAAFAAVVLAGRGAIGYAFIAFMAAGLADLFDGVLARRLRLGDEARAFGGHLDSVVDACSFGLAPALLLQAIGLPLALSLPLGFAYVCAAVWRLAYFDTQGLGGEGAARWFTGVPVTYGALVIPLAGLCGFAGLAAFRTAIAAAAALHAALMVSPVRIRKPFGPWYAVLLLAAAAMIATYAVHAERFAALAPPGGH